ncbi:hypothetical protein OHAE_3626 [Ochrobactrum soli]|uniref:Uncharacterized protein n=1 Tax=Ochrobactrum soli TaxID=2448455 RepID=A0A2P9HHW1_9HYPH|nr:hypothetical protein OHAE_3626 [[Ochrobactrum] soli]
MLLFDFHQANATVVFDDYGAPSFVIAVDINPDGLTVYHHGAEVARLLVSGP